MGLLLMNDFPPEILSPTNDRIFVQDVLCTGSISTFLVNSSE